MTITTDHPTPTRAELEAAASALPTLIAQWDGASASVLGILGDRLGLFRALAAQGPSSVEALAAATSTERRYVEEWATGSVAAGFLAHDPGAATFSLAPGMGLILGRDDTQFSFGGAFQNFGALLRVLDDVEFSFRHGGGVHQQHYGDDCYEGMTRSTAAWHDHLLVPAWIPAVPGLHERLVAGARIADIGCGHGRAAIRLATAYPDSTVVGYDVHPPSVDAAGRAAAEAGVADRVRFETLDAADGLPEAFDLVLALDVVHDAADPAALLRAVGSALKSDGVFLVLEIRCEATLEANAAAPLGATRYAMSLLYCLTTSLARGGAGLGTCGLPEPVLRTMAAEAGFPSMEVVVGDGPFNVLYALRAAN